MLVSQILKTLPAPLEWMVLFNLSAIRKLANAAITRAMYHLPSELDLEPYSHVVLCSQGRFLAFSDEPKLIEPISGKTWTSEQIKTSLHDRFLGHLALFPVDAADCLGLGEMSPFSPVLLHIKIEAGYGKAQAIFNQQPSQKDYELLKAVGVKFVGGETKDSYYLAHFQNRLPTHIHAGILSHFSRTANCNVFFLRHGDIDEHLKDGLLKAATSRVIWGRNKSFQTLAQLAQVACQQSMAMTCQPAPPAKSFSYGDLVPLGFVLKALNQAKMILTNSIEDPGLVMLRKSVVNACEELRQFLLSKRQNKLWAFHTDRLITATDSALILQGFYDSESVEALEIFADGLGGYYPQLWSEDKQAEKMVVDKSCIHWCQSDYATTCLVKALRQKLGLETKTSTEYIAAGMANRSGLYFANPYLVDWVVACAVSKDESAALLRKQLLADILASMNDDYSFGIYDVAFSTALAILCMAELGFRGRTLQLSQLRLLDFMDAQGSWPAAIPFYSSLRIDEQQIPVNALLGLLMSQQSTGTKQKQIRKVQEKYYEISLYFDTHSIITTSIAALALSEECSVTNSDWELNTSQQSVHPRYQCCNHSEYITKFVLTSYIHK
ncbi:hypothetical protein [Cylindrospermum sp. FACHB-282]|uniref:hypothetical protein n=1 Tax=Cylindrospermum sp. FACHB-282 TaxID=2692794 RepID=UPI001685F014|nr:hypothetical protein [Cylindrospermum sp. FACHB-282]MBD2387083.1 hypothetical protein [Cylindrospermum sp. FACHB-282]